MKLSKEVISALVDELEKRGKQAATYAEDSKNEPNFALRLRYLGMADAYNLMCEELKNRGELVEWQD